MTPRERAQAAVARARSMPHILELDDVERELLAAVLHDATLTLPGRLHRSRGEVEILHGLRQRVALPYREAGAMGSSDGLGAA